jgi:hypothetical protein
MLHRRVQLIKICDGDVFADLLDSCIEFALVVIVDKYIRVLCDEPLCRDEAYATVPTGDDCNFS